MAYFRSIFDLAMTRVQYEGASTQHRYRDPTLFLLGQKRRDFGPKWFVALLLLFSVLGRNRRGAHFEKPASPLELQSHDPRAIDGRRFIRHLEA